MTAGTGRLIKVLLVDDEEEFLAATAPALARRGFEVMTASSGQAALERLAEHAVAVVVLDVKMPGLGGEEVYDRIRQSHPDLPVLMLTGHGTAPQAFKMTKSGVFDYLAKPCSIEELVARLKSALERAAPPLAGPEHPRVLLVDDELELIAALTPALERRGIVVVSAGDGEQALACLAEQAVDVVVLDVRLPGMDGIEVLERVKKLRPEVEVLLLSGHPDVEIAVEGIRRGAADYLTKPPDVDRLAARIREASKSKQARGDARREDVVRRAVERTPE